MKKVCGRPFKMPSVRLVKTETFQRGLIEIFMFGVIELDKA